MKNKSVPTEFGKQVLRARLSIHESQEAFGKRFGVDLKTISRWETGQVRLPSKIYKQLMRAITNKLAQEGRLLSPEAIERIFAAKFQENEPRHSGDFDRQNRPSDLGADNLQLSTVGSPANPSET